MDETQLINRIAKMTDTNVRPVSNSLDAVNVTLDITFHGVIDMVSVTSHLYGVMFSVLLKDKLFLCEFGSPM